jgi:catechol 2,3-dioxygenase-like lactoylglutathione lyase family enzyme
MPVRGFDHVAITVDDVDRSVRFYCDVLGAEARFVDEFHHKDFPVVSLIIGANRINVHPSPPRVADHLVARLPTPGSADLCFRWDGPVSTALALLEEHGLPLVEGPVRRASADGLRATSVYTVDPDGNLIEFLTTDEPATPRAPGGR